LRSLYSLSWSKVSSLVLEITFTKTHQWAIF
jgi:hypothetical protein